MEEKRVGWLARDKSGNLWLYGNRPKKQMDEWGDGWAMENIESSHFPEVKWEDEEPTEVEITIKIK